MSGKFPDPVTVRLPGGASAALALTRPQLAHGSASAAVTKDAGDDPDVTHGAVVWARVCSAPAGTGVVVPSGRAYGQVDRLGTAVIGC